MLLLYILIFKSNKNKETKFGISILIYLIIIALFSSPINMPELILVAVLGIELIIKNGEFKKVNFSVKVNLINYTTLIFSLFVLSIATIKLHFVYRLKNVVYIQNKPSYKKLVYFNEDNLYSTLNLANYFLKKDNIEGLKLIERVFHKNYAPKLGRIIALNYERRKKINKTKYILNYNYFTEPYRYKPKMDLLYFYEKQKNINKVISIAKEVIDFPIKIQSDKVFKYKSIADKKLGKYSKLIEITNAKSP